MKQARWSVLGALSIALVACGDTNDSTTALPPAPSMAAIGAAEVMVAGLDSVRASLQEGAGLSESGVRITLLAAYTAEADFDGDGVLERAALVTAEPTGDGVFMGLVGFREAEGGPVQVADKLLGNDQRIHRFETVGDSLLIELTTQGPDDAACCPTRRAQQIYRIEEGTWRLWRDNTLTSNGTAPATSSRGARSS